MQTEYQYINFIKQESKTKTDVFNIVSVSGRNILGQIKWFGRWRQYCFFPSNKTIFNKGCLEDINNFITQLMDARKGKKS